MRRDQQRAEPTYPWRNGLVLGALLLPALLYGAVAWQERLIVLEQARQSLQSTTRVLAEHAGNVVQTYSLVDEMVSEHVRGMGWMEIAGSASLHEYLANIVKDEPRIKAISLIDPTGVVRNSSSTLSSPDVSVADRDYFIATTQGSAVTFVGEVTRDRISQQETFCVARRLSTPSSRFDGDVVVYALPSDLTEVWTTVGDPGSSALLVRQDGKVLATWPPDSRGAASVQLDSALVQAMTTGQESGLYQATSPIDGTEQMVAYRKAGDLGVYVARGVNLQAALGPWYDQLRLLGIVFLVGTAGMVSLAFLASRRLRQLHDTALALHHEVERRESVEVQLWESRKMDALGRLAGQSAHDFGNILSVISGSLDLLELRPNDGEAVKLARRATERGLKMISSLLTFARRKPPHRELLDLNAAITSFEDLIRQAVGSEVRLQIMTEATPCWVATDPGQLELAILNIAVNARDAMPNGGALTITVLTRDLTGDPDGLVGNYAAIMIKDTGHGMPADILTNAFEPFFTTKEPGKGTGLGLSMVYGFTKQFGGTVTIESVPGRGTTLAIYLPIGLPAGSRDAAAVTSGA
jgi:two-component system NtrC family sensor kinase